jgi:hypothetical protein
VACARAPSAAATLNAARTLMSVLLQCFIRRSFGSG